MATLFLQGCDTKHFAMAGPPNHARLLWRMATLDFLAPSSPLWAGPFESPLNVWADSPC